MTSTGSRHHSMAQGRQQVAVQLTACMLLMPGDSVQEDDARRQQTELPARSGITILHAVSCTVSHTASC